MALAIEPNIILNPENGSAESADRKARDAQGRNPVRRDGQTCPALFARAVGPDVNRRNDEVFCQRNRLDNANRIETDRTGRDRAHFSANFTPDRDCCTRKAGTNRRITHATGTRLNRRGLSGEPQKGQQGKQKTVHRRAPDRRSKPVRPVPACGCDNPCTSKVRRHAVGTGPEQGRNLLIREPDVASISCSLMVLVAKNRRQAEQVLASSP